MRTTQDVLDRLRAEYLEMPGLRLKPEQVQRLCGVEQTMCQLALDSLVDARFLCVKPDGHYARSSDGEIPRPRPAKAGLSPADSLENKASFAAGRDRRTVPGERRSAPDRRRGDAGR